MRLHFKAADSRSEAGPVQSLVSGLQARITMARPEVDVVRENCCDTLAIVVDANRVELALANLPDLIPRTLVDQPQ